MEDGPSMEKEKKKCNICGKNLAFSSFSRHMKDKPGTTQACKICGKSFQTLSGLESHQSKAHVVKVISHFKCHFCEYTSMNKYYMTDHIRRQHAGEGSNSFVCNKCYTRKQNEHLLRKHMQQHQESNCVVCGKKFNSNKNLKRHGRVHEIKRCQECGKNFNSKKDLRVHKKDHHKKKASQVNVGEEYDIDHLADAEFIMHNMDHLPEIDNETLAALL